MLSGSTPESLLQAFRNPSSPFYLREGEVGPASPDEPPRQTAQAQSFATVAGAFTSDNVSFAEAAEEARAYASNQGHDPDSFFEQKVVWGDLDSFQHLNNVRYVRFLESGRIQWMAKLAEEVGGPEASAKLLTGKGIGLILKSISIDFKQPVVYPDTLLISHRPRPTDPPSDTHFNNDAIIYSYAQGKVVATSESVLVWYDYDALKKSPPSEAMKAALARRMQL
ncbi:hypothetical protein M422DRAFT_24049 [Sphaerobolus stellatus SS14]|nr:hypothetical protein M422DRAFT_24049 [Sphaerobolus stellatus SS14]